jgi:hypothetical protein
MDSFKIYPRPIKRHPPHQPPRSSAIKFIAILRDKRLNLNQPVQELPCTSREQAEHCVRGWLEIAKCNTGEVVEVKHG